MSSNASGRSTSSALIGDSFFVFSAKADSTRNDGGITSKSIARNLTIQLSDVFGASDDSFSGLFPLLPTGALSTTPVTLVMNFALHTSNTLSTTKDATQIKTGVEIIAGAGKDFLDIKNDPNNTNGRFTSRGSKTINPLADKTHPNGIAAETNIPVNVLISSKDIDAAKNLNLYFKVTLSEFAKKGAVGNASLTLATEPYLKYKNGNRTPFLQDAGITAQVFPVPVPEPATVALFVLGGAIVAFVVFKQIRSLRRAS